MNTVSNEKNLLISLGFTAKENSNGIYQKKYADNYTIEIDFVNEKFNYGNLIQAESKTTQNFSQKENWVVLECVDRLLEKGYTPNRITLEKVFPSGHGTSGRLDILVSRDDGTAYMMIECKTWGSEFEKEFKNLNKDGGQLFTYFQQDNNTDILVLYASRYNEYDKCVEYTNQILKVEEEYRTAGNVKDFYDRWNKVTKNNGVFNDWNTPYNYESKALTPKDLIEIKQEDSSFIFNRFMEILRHNVVSDKPNAFNKIFTLFLCKIMDEKSTKTNKQLEFQWLEGIDDNIKFQKRLTDLYQRGMKEFLDKEVTDLSDKEFEEKFGTLDNTVKDLLLREFTKVRLQKNNEFAIKDVFDEETFNENAIVVKEIVELLQNYKIRYTKKQQFLSDFFELLLTTGLKQEVGQFFTPVPIAKFIIRSIPFDTIIKTKLTKGERDELLPNVIDYAVGSGHFITEAMDEIQKVLNMISADDFVSDTAKKINSWKEDHFDWAFDYVYGIEKDYRLVKTAKVGCYLHGDGLAKVIHGDGLSRFVGTKEFKGKLQHSHKDYPQDNKKFDIVVSNPPYSVSAFKNISKKFDNSDFELYGRLTDQSSEIEALFIERTKQLLKDGGIAGLILPSSILNNGGIYSDARGIILKYFDIVGITELGSNTFMATGTNTVVLFLRRRNNADHRNIKESIAKLFENKNDITINGVEAPLSKYLAHAYEGMGKEEYFAGIENIAEEQEKFLYFVIAYPQKVVIVKTGSKNDEKKFLGYEFSTRRGSEGIHPIQRDKTIDECTKLYDPNCYENEKRASSYIYSAYKGEFKTIDETLKENVSYTCLVDMLDFERIGFRNTISLSIKKKVDIDSKYPLVVLSDFCENITKGTTPTTLGFNFIESGISFIKVESILQNGTYDTNKFAFISEKCHIKMLRSQLKENDILFSIAGALGRTAIVSKTILPANTNQAISIIRLKQNSDFILTYLYEVLRSEIIQNQIDSLKIGIAQPNLSLTQIGNFKIPNPPIDIQEKIVKECEFINAEVKKASKIIIRANEEIENDFRTLARNANIAYRLSNDTIFNISIGKRVVGKEIEEYQENGIPVYSANVFVPFGYINKQLIKDFSDSSILWGIDGDWMVNHIPSGYPFYPTDHCGVLRLKTSNINPRYLTFALKEAGVNARFSRTIRASIDRIKGLTINFPTPDKQNIFAKKVEKLENEITEAKLLIESEQAKKEAIFKKYL